MLSLPKMLTKIKGRQLFSPSKYSHSLVASLWSIWPDSHYDCRYSKLLLYMGLPVYQAKDFRANHFCKIISEFALEYRTTREKVVQQLEKKANQRERKKTRGKMIVDVSRLQTRILFFIKVFQLFFYITTTKGNQSKMSKLPVDY